MNEIPNFTGVNAMPRLRIGERALNSPISLSPRAVVRRTFELFDQPRRHVVIFDGLAVGSDVAPGAVEIGLAHVERIEAEIPGDGVDHALDRQHALRAAEAAERGVRHGVGLDAPRIDLEFGKEIGVVGMEHGAIDHAEAEIGGASAARVKIEVDGADAPVGFVADRVLDGEIVPFAGHRHVGVAVEPELARLAGHARRQGRDHRPLRRLRFLAAEAAAHAAHAAGDEGVRQRQNAGDDVLHFARMLGRGIDQDRAVLAGHGERRPGLPDKNVPGRRCGSLPALRNGAAAIALRGVAVDEGIVRQHALAGCSALLDGDVRRLRIDLDPAAQHRAPRRVARRRNDREHRLAMEIDAVVRKHRFVGMRRRNIVFSRNVGRRDDGDDAGSVAHLAQIDPANGATRHRRAADGDMQASRSAPEYRRHIRRRLARAWRRCRAATACGHGAAAPPRAASLGGIGNHPAIGDTRDFRADAGNFGERLDDQIAGDAAAIGRRWRADR